MSTIISDSSQWRQLPRLSSRPAVKSSSSNSSVWEDFISFTSLATLLGMIVYLLLR